jgi:hypothetical protein
MFIKNTLIIEIYDLINEDIIDFDIASLAYIYSIIKNIMNCLELLVFASICMRFIFVKD